MISAPHLTAAQTVAIICCLSSQRSINSNAAPHSMVRTTAVLSQHTTYINKGCTQMLFPWCVMDTRKHTHLSCGCHFSDCVFFHPQLPEEILCLCAFLLNASCIECFVFFFVDPDKSLLRYYPYPLKKKKQWGMLHRRLRFLITTYSHSDLSLFN